jgi:hypothetical protein
VKVFLIHGGLWDGWWLYERGDGRYRLMREVTSDEVKGLAALHLEDVTPSPAPGRVPHGFSPRAVSRVDTSARARALGLTLLTPEA